MYEDPYPLIMHIKSRQSRHKCSLSKPEMLRFLIVKTGSNQKMKRKGPKRVTALQILTEIDNEF